MKKMLALLLAVAMILSLAACKKAEEPSNSGSTNSGTTNTDTKTDNGGSTEEKTTITMWCIATESDSNHNAYVKAIEEVTAKYPNVDFQWEAIENETYKTKIAAAMAANETPDIFFTWSCAFLGDFVNQGKVYCLDDTLSKYSSELPESMLGNTTYGGKHYGVPTTMNIVALFANMDLLAQAGWEDRKSVV